MRGGQTQASWRGPRSGRRLPGCGRDWSGQSGKIMQQARDWTAETGAVTCPHICNPPLTVRNIGFAGTRSSRPVVQSAMQRPARMRLRTSWSGGRGTCCGARSGNARRFQRLLRFVPIPRATEPLTPVALPPGEHASGRKKCLRIKRLPDLGTAVLRLRALQAVTEPQQPVQPTGAEPAKYDASPQKSLHKDVLVVGCDGRCFCFNPAAQTAGLAPPNEPSPLEAVAESIQSSTVPSEMQRCAHCSFPGADASHTDICATLLGSIAFGQHPAPRAAPSHTHRQRLPRGHGVPQPRPRPLPHLCTPCRSRRLGLE